MVFMAKDPLEGSLMGWRTATFVSSPSCLHLRRGFPNGRIIAKKSSEVVITPAHQQHARFQSGR
jgi:hypothetical protein